MLIECVRCNRRVVADLEERRARPVYGVFSYSREQAEKLVKAAESIVSLLERVER